MKTANQWTRVAPSAVFLFALSVSAPRALSAPVCGDTRDDLANPTRCRQRNVTAEIGTNRDTGAAVAVSTLAASVAQCVAPNSALNNYTVAGTNESGLSATEIGRLNYAQENKPERVFFAASGLAVSAGEKEGSQAGSSTTLTEFLSPELTARDGDALFTVRSGHNLSGKKRFEYVLGLSSSVREKSRGLAAAAPAKEWVGAPYLSPFTPAPGLRLFNCSF